MYYVLIDKILEDKEGIHFFYHACIVDYEQLSYILMKG